MKKFCIVWASCFLLVAGCCYCQKETDVMTEIISQTQPENSPLGQDLSASKTQTTIPEISTPAVATTSAPSFAKEKESVDTTDKKIVPSQKTAASPEETTSVFDVAAAQQLIEQKRSAQTLQTPQADKAVFKNENLISTNNRLLGPLAYEPVVQTPTVAPWSQEELKYGVYYSFVKAGTAYIKNRGLVTLGDKQAYLIQTTAFSASVIDSVFKVRDVNYSWIDTRNFTSWGYTQSLREGNYVRDEWVIFDDAHHRYYGEVKKKKEPRTIAGEMTIPVLDVLSSLYYVRAQKLEVGKDIIFDIINREEQYPLVVKVTGKETVKTAAGKFNCFVVEPQFRGEGIFVSKGKSLKVWLTDDKYKMPIKMQTEVFIGSVSAELLEYKRN